MYRRGTIYLQYNIALRLVQFSHIFVIVVMPSIAYLMVNMQRVYICAWTYRLLELCSCSVSLVECLIPYCPVSIRCHLNSQGL